MPVLVAMSRNMNMTYGQETVYLVLSVIVQQSSGTLHFVPNFGK